MSRILVTGASGFIGRAAAVALAKAGHSIRAAMRPSARAEFPDRVEVVRHPDYTAGVDWRPLLEGSDAVIHAAGIGDTGHGMSAELYDRINRSATAQLANEAARAGIGRFLFVSSIRAQSGPAADHDLTERDPALPSDAYGRSKLAAEEAIGAAGVPFTILRPVTLYGPGVKGNLGLIMRVAASPWPLPIKGFGNRRSLLGIDNLISAIAFALSATSAIGETYVVADPGFPPRLRDVIATLRQARGRRPRLFSVPAYPIELALRLVRRADLWQRFGGDLRVDPAKLMGAGWQPLHDTLGGLSALAKTATP
jgi:nucleoside-diphosphate-sugar epimerase